MNASKPPSSIFCGWLLFFCGICMGAADLIPGISGGTIAFILGFYHPLLDGLKTFSWSNFQQLFKGEYRLFFQSVAWRFLLTLLTGIACAFVGLANFFHIILEHEVYRVYLYATFLGLILASFVFCIRQIYVWNSQIVLGLCLGALIAYMLTESTLVSTPEGHYAVPIELESGIAIPLRNYDSHYHLLTGLSSQTLSTLLTQGLLQDTTPVYNQQYILVGLVGDLIMSSHPISFFNGWLMVCGVFAVCALLLPGISGSYILTLLGVYPLVIESLVEFINALKQFSFNSEAFAVLWSLGLGVILGAIGFSRLLSWLLQCYPNQSLALLSGFMIGAIRCVWPFWSYEYVLVPIKIYKGPQLVTLHPFFPSWNSPLIWQAIGCACLGFILVFALEAFAQRKSFRMPQ